jgi:hypothetical protein
VDVARLTGLGASTVSILIRDLKDWGLVEVIGKGAVRRRGGKPSEVLAVARDAGSFLTVYIDSESVRIARVGFGDAKIEPISSERVSLSVPAVRDLVVSHIDSMSRSNRFLGIGISVASVVTDDGSVGRSAAFETSLPDLESEVRRGCRRASLPIVVENDANCAAYYAYHQSETKPRSVLAFLHQASRPTIGAGIVIDGRLHRGRNGAAGELVSPEIRFDPLPRRSAIETVVRFFDPDLVAFCGKRTSGNLQPASLGAETVTYPGDESVFGGVASIASGRLVPYFVGTRSEP